MNLLDANRVALLALYEFVQIEQGLKKQDRHSKGSKDSANESICIQTDLRRMRYMHQCIFRALLVSDIEELRRHVRVPQVPFVEDAFADIVNGTALHGRVLRRGDEGTMVRVERRGLQRR